MRIFFFRCQCKKISSMADLRLWAFIFVCYFLNCSLILSCLWRRPEILELRCALQLSWFHKSRCVRRTTLFPIYPMGGSALLVVKKPKQNQTAVDPWWICKVDCNLLMYIILNTVAACHGLRLSWPLDE